MNTPADQAHLDTREEQRQAAADEDADCRRKEREPEPPMDETAFDGWKRGYAKGWESGQADIRDRIEQLEAENGSLRNDNADLRAQLADVPSVLEVKMKDGHGPSVLIAS